MAIETIELSQLTVREAVATDKRLTIDENGALLFTTTAAATQPTVNNPPVLNDQNLTVVVGEDLTITLGSVTDPDNDSVTYIVTGNGASYYTVVTPNTGTFNAPAAGSQVINVSADDGQGGLATSVITVDVTAAQTVPQNTAPVVSDQTLSVEENQDLVITLGAVNDADGDAITYTVAGSGAANYTITTANTGTFNSSVVGSETLTISADDGNGGTASATITVTVTAAVANPAPVINDQNLTTSATADLVIVLGPATTGGGETITYGVTGGSAFVAGPASNEITYNAPVAGTETLTVTGTAAIGGSTTATITIVASAAVAGLHTKIAYNGWSTMENNLEGQNTASSTNPSAEHNPSLYKLVGQMYAANGIQDYVDDFEFLDQGGENINGAQAKANINTTSSTVAVLSAYGSNSGIIMEPAQADEVPTTGNNGWIDRMVDIAQTAEARNIIPIMFQCWGSSGREADYDHAKINTDALQAKHGMLVVRSAEIVDAMTKLNPAYTTNSANAGGKYVPPVTHLFNGGTDNDGFHGSYAMQYLCALATFKCLTGISAADNAFVIPSGGNAGSQYGMSTQFINDIKTQVDLVQVESLVTGLAPGAAPIANNFARIGSHDVAAMVNVVAASNLRDDVDIDLASLTIKSVTAAHFASHSLTNGVFSYTPANSYTGDSSVVFTYTDADSQAIDITLTLSIAAAPVIEPQEIIIGFGEGNTANFAADGSLYNHRTTAGGKTINLVRSFDGQTTQGNLQDAAGVGMGTIASITSGNLVGPGYSANDGGQTVTYGPYVELYDGLSTAPKGSTVAFEVGGLVAGINYRINLAGMVAFRAFTNVVSVDVNGVKGSYDCDPANVTEYEKVIKADSRGVLAVTLISDGASAADVWGLSYVHINKITDGTPADTPAKPVFTQVPQNINVTQGQAATFTAAATGAASYQWYRDGIIINGATASSYTLITQAGDDGVVISVEAKNLGGITLSSNATLILLTAAPSIEAQPVNSLTVVEGDLINLSVVAVGATSYKWKKNGAEIVGETGSTLSIPALVSDDGVVITVDCINDFDVVPSSACTLIITAAKTQYWFSIGRSDGTAQDLADGYAGWVPGSNAEGSAGQDINFFAKLKQAGATIQNVFRDAAGTVTDLKLVYQNAGTNTSDIGAWGDVDSDAILNQNVINKLTAASVYSHSNLWAYNCYLTDDHTAQFEFSAGGLIVGETWKVQVIGIHYQDAARPVDVVVNGAGNAGNMNVGAWADFDVFEVITSVDGAGKIILSISPQVNASIGAIRLIKV